MRSCPLQRESPDRPNAAGGGQDRQVVVDCERPYLTTRTHRCQDEPTETHHDDE
jgi:hypothetical protein